MTEDEVGTNQPQAGGFEGGSVRARNILKVPRAWILPLAIPAVMIVLVTSIYIGSVINPLGHLHGLPVRVVDQDAGATDSSGQVVLGQSVVRALQHSAGVTSRLQLQVTTLTKAQSDMDRGTAYVTVVIPSDFTSSALLDAGFPAPAGSTPPTVPAVALLENSRLGSLGVSLAVGVLTPAISQISSKLGAQLTAQSTAAVRANPVLSAQVADPITLTTSIYRPLPSRSALGLSAFYVALIAILAGFLAGTVINSSIDSVLGYAATDMGPKWKMRMPLPITRRQTLLTKLSVAMVAAPLLTGVILLVAIVGFGMYAPNFALLWLLLALAALMVSSGTLALLAAFGNLGQLLAMVVLVYLSLSSSGGTVPIQALPGFFKAVGEVEPLRQVLGGARDILYFGAQWDAGFSHAMFVLAVELVLWLVVGFGFTSWYDHRKLYRLPPDMMSYISQAVADRTGA